MARYSIEITDAQIKRLREIARTWGYVNSRGPKVGDGNIHELAAALADGKLAVVKTAPNGHEQ